MSVSLYSDVVFIGTGGELLARVPIVAGEAKFVNEMAADITICNIDAVAPWRNYDVEIYPDFRPIVLPPGCAATVKINPPRIKWRE